MLSPTLKYAVSALGLTLLTAVTRPALADLPHLFETTKEGAPGDLVVLTGDQFGAAPEVWLDRVQDDADTPNPELQLTEVLSRSNWSITVSLPKTLSAGLYAIFVRNSSGTSSPLYINRAEAWSSLDLAGNEANSASTFRLYGWNLSVAGATPTVRLVDTQTLVSVPVSSVVKLANPYTLQVSLAGVPGLQPGRSYDLYVSNGYGGGYGEVKGPRITYASSFALWNLPPWIQHLQAAAGTQFNVKGYGAKGDGATDDQLAVQTAIDAAALAGGGVVYFPSGRYRVASGVVLKSNVVLKGDPPSGGDYPSIVVGDLNPTGDPYYKAVITIAGGSSMLGLRNVKVESTATGPGWAVKLEGGHHLFVSACDLSSANPNGGAISTLNSTNVAVRDNKLLQNVDLNHSGNPINFRSTDDMLVVNNTFTFFQGRLDLTDSDNVQFEGNYVRHLVQSGSQIGRGIWHQGKNVALLANQVSKEGAGAYATNRNDGESFAIDGFPQKGFGTVTSSSVTSISDSSRTWPADALAGQSVTIVRGKGTGQVRHIQGNAGSTLTLTAPWALTPDGTSRYAINDAAERVLIYGNSSSNQWHGGIITYGATVHDYIVAANTLTNAAGIQVVTIHSPEPGYDRFSVATNVLIRGNTVKRTVGGSTPDVPPSNILIHAALPEPSFGTGIFAPVVRRNTLDVRSPNLFVSTDGESFVAQGYRGNPDTTTPAMIGTVFDSNDSVRVERPYLLNQGAVQTVIRPGHGTGHAALVTETGTSNSTGTVVDDVACRLPLNSVSAGTTPDTSRFAAPATLYGNTAAAPGLRAGALTFDGAGDYVGVPYAPQFAGLHSFTVAAWVRTAATSSSHTILSTRYGTDYTFDLKVLQNKVSGDIGTGSSWIATSLEIGPNDTGTNGEGGSILPNLWYHIAYVVDNDAKTFRLYLNGDLKRTVPFSAAKIPQFMNPQNLLTVGSNNNGVNENLNGRLDEVIVLSRALGTLDVKALVDDAAARLPFDSVYQNTTPDTSRPGAIATLYGNTFQTPGIKGGALTFDGAGDYVGISSGPQFANLRSYTAASWVRLNALSSSHTILSTRYGTDYTFDLKVSQNKVSGDVGTGTSWIATSLEIGPNDTGSNGQGGVLSLNTWYHVAYVVDDDAKVFRLYLNGDLKRSVPFAAGLVPQFMNSQNLLTVGSNNNGVNENLNGLLDEPVVFNRALSSAQVKGLAAP